MLLSYYVIGYWLLVIGYWLLVIDYWLLVIGFLILIRRVRSTRWIEEHYI